jgi:hypothetical protein
LSERIVVAIASRMNQTYFTRGRSFTIFWQIRSVQRLI